MQQSPSGQQGRSGLSRDTLEAIYVGILFYRFKQQVAAEKEHVFAELGEIVDRLRTMETIELERAIKQAVAEIASHGAPDSGLVALLRLWLVASS